MALPYLARRGEVFYFRRAVPKALVPLLARREIKLSLQTDRRPTATIRCREMTNAFDRMLGGLTGMTALTEEQIATLLRKYFIREWARANEVAYLTPDDRDLDSAHEAALAVEQAGVLRQRAAKRSYVAADRAEAVSLLEEHGYTEKGVGLEGINLLCNGILRAQSETQRMLAAMLEGRYEEAEPSDPLFRGMTSPSLPPQEGQTQAAPVGSVMSLSELFEAWRVERKPPAKTIAEFSKAIRRFNELHGDVPAVTITKPMVREYKAALQKLPAVLSGSLRKMAVPELLHAIENEAPGKTLSIGAINKDLGSLSAVLAWAGKQGYFDGNPMWSNPVSGMKMESGPETEDERAVYDAGDLKAIFNSPIYRNGKRPLGGGGEAAKWIPLLGLFTGARLEEIGQALVADVRKEEGISYIALTLEGGGKKLKNKSSRRSVPLHPLLIDFGFLDYVSERRKSDDPHLFPDLRPDQFGKRTGNWSKWWGRYVRDEVGIADPRKVFHSFRHGFKAACRAAEIEEEVHDAITGHAGGGVGRQYGKNSVSLKVLNRAIEKVGYDVDFSHLLKKSGSGGD